MAMGKIAAKNTKSAKAMKPSGVAWLGDIPEGWEMRRLKTCFSIVSGSGFKEHLQGRTDGDYPVFKARDIGKADVTLNYSKNWITSDEVETEGFKIIPANSILMPKIGEAMRKNSRAISGVACCVDNNCQGLLPRMVDVKLSYYLLCSIDVRAFDNGGAIPCINNQAFLDFSCPFPPLPEQRAIADYLDEKCAAIDGAVDELKRGIEDCKAWKKAIIFEAVTGKANVLAAKNAKVAKRQMRDSGLPWLGDMPEEWEMKRLRYLATSFRKGAGITKADVIENGGIACIRYGEIYSRYKNYVAVEKCLSRTNENLISCPQRIYKGDILFSCTGELVEEIGKNIAYLGDEECLAGGDIIVVGHNQDPVFLSYALNSYAQTQKSHDKTKLKVVHISTGDIKNLLVAIPPLAEQRAIADYLDEKCAAIDALVAEKEALIADLEAYKKSLIYETVTGKREVA